MSIESEAPGRSGVAVLSTLDKGLQVLDELSVNSPANGLTLTQLAGQLGMHRSTLFRILTTLRAREYVYRDPQTDRYRLGIQVLALSAALLEQLDPREVAKTILRSLCDQTQELVHLAILDGDDVVTVERVEGKQPLSLQTEIGVRRPVYCSASGKAMLAHLPMARVDHILALGMPRMTPTTITTREEMLSHLDEARARGYSWDDEERIEGVRCVAAVVRGHDGSVVGAVSIAAPAVRMPWERVWMLGEEVRQAANEIARELGLRKITARQEGSGSAER